MLRPVYSPAPASPSTPLASTRSRPRVSGCDRGPHDSNRLRSVATRKTKRRPAKRSLRARPRMVRLRVCSQLTEREVRGLQARAAADMRSVGSYVSLLLIADLKRRRPGRKRRAGGVSPGDERSAYKIAVPLTPEQKRKVEAQARDEVRSVSSYVALLIVADLRRG